MLASIQKPLAFIQRDFINETTYRFSFLTQFFGILVSTLTFFFVAKLLKDVGASYMKPYGGSYFSFVLIGVAFFSYLGVSLQSLSKSIREGQMLGTLEALLVTQTEIPTILVCSSLYGFLWSSFRVAVYLLLGVFAFGVDIGNANVAGALLILVLTIVSFSSLGIISASFIMVLKKGDPVSWVFTGLSSLLGGLYYPISILPDWLQSISYLLPITYSLEGMRFALLKGYSLNELLPCILPLVIFSVIMVPLSVVIFGYAVKRAKRDGTLTQY
ncbi:MAG TPA: ABC transporter permease [Thermodesulfobacteriota bacterium]|nr:ABC transporter permease [Thermodesulfobacteriota bacterium]